MLVEVCANSLKSAMAAQNGGAHRIEYCDNLFEGGTTPSFGAVTTLRKNIRIPIHVLIRPRGGDFLYDHSEVEIMIHDILQMKNIGVDGVVIGALDRKGNIDKQMCKLLIEAALPLHLTFHRAFDMAANPDEALEDIISLGFQTLLTSGQKRKAHDGIPILKSLVNKANGRINLMPGGGVNEENIAEIASQTGAHSFHVSLRNRVSSEMQFRNPEVKMGGIEGISEYILYQTDESRVRKVINILTELGI